ncbi:MAG TPA: VWA domain-containing protein [Albitalea sp.]
MSFLAGEALWFLGLLPLLVAGHLLLLRRRRRWPVRLSSVGLVREAQSSASRWRRRVPPALMLAGLAALIVAVARPTAVMTIASEQQTVVLAMDVSGSMQAHDVWPDRLSASQKAAKTFVSRLPPDVRVGVVTYGGTAHVVQPPTRSRDDVMSSIDRFVLQPGTAIGSGLVFALATVFPRAGIDIDALASGSRLRKPIQLRMRDDGGESDAPAVEPGSYRSAIIVLLSDGQNTTGVDPIEAAQLAARLGVRVFTVGFGTPEGDLVAFGGWTVRVKLDEATLREVAGITRGEYFRAASGQELDSVYRTMGSRIAVERRDTELTGLFAGLAAVLLLAASALSLWWHGRIV